MMSRLIKDGIECTYSLLNGLMYEIRNANKVFLGGSAVLSNGNLMGKIGTSMVALAGHTFKHPVIAFCETYKFSDKVNLDALSSNELGSPSDLEFP